MPAWACAIACISENSREQCVSFCSKKRNFGASRQNPSGIPQFPPLTTEFTGLFEFFLLKKKNVNLFSSFFKYYLKSIYVTFVCNLYYKSLMLKVLKLVLSYTPITLKLHILIFVRVLNAPLVTGSLLPPWLR